MMMTALGMVTVLGMVTLLGMVTVLGILTIIEYKLTGTDRRTNLGIGRHAPPKSSYFGQYNDKN